MDDIKLQKAKAALAKFAEHMDAMDWHYTKDVENLSIECGARGEDFPIDLHVKFNPDLELIQILSHMPFTIPEDKRVDIAIAVAYVNNTMVDGCFDFEISSGHMFFRMASSFKGIEIGKKTVEYLLYCSCATIDNYNDKFLMIAKDMLDLEKFLADEN